MKWLEWLLLFVAGGGLFFILSVVCIVVLVRAGSGYEVDDAD